MISLILSLLDIHKPGLAVILKLRVQIVYMHLYVGHSIFCDLEEMKSPVMDWDCDLDLHWPTIV